MNKKYEMTIILSPDREEKDVAKLTQEFTTILNNYGAQEIINIRTERRAFAYPIKKHSEGTYVFIDFQGPPTLPEKVRQELQHREEILRLAFFCLPHQTEKPATPVTPTNLPTADEQPPTVKDEPPAREMSNE